MCGECIAGGQHLNSYGLNGYGLNSYGLYSYGLYSYGVYRQWTVRRVAGSAALRVVPLGERAPALRPQSLRRRGRGSEAVVRGRAEVSEDALRNARCPSARLIPGIMIMIIIIIIITTMIMIMIIIITMPDAHLRG